MKKNKLSLNERSRQATPDELAANVEVLRLFIHHIGLVLAVMMEEEKGRRFVPFVDFEMLFDLLDPSSARALYSQCIICFLKRWQESAATAILPKGTRLELESYERRLTRRLIKARNEYTSASSGHETDDSDWNNWMNTKLAVEARAVEAEAESLIRLHKLLKEINTETEAAYIGSVTPEDETSLVNGYKKVLGASRRDFGCLHSRNDERDAMNLAAAHFVRHNPSAKILPKIVTATKPVRQANSDLVIGPIDIFLIAELFKQYGRDSHHISGVLLKCQAVLADLAASAQDVCDQVQSYVDRQSEADGGAEQCTTDAGQALAQLKDILEQTRDNAAVTFLRNLLGKATAYTSDGYLFTDKRSKAELMPPCAASALSTERASRKLAEAFNLALDRNAIPKDFGYDMCSDANGMTFYHKATCDIKMPLRICQHVQQDVGTYYSFTWPTACGVVGLSKALERCLTVCGAYSKTVVLRILRPRKKPKLIECDPTDMPQRLDSILGRNSTTISNLRAVTDLGDVHYERTIATLRETIGLDDIMTTTITVVTTDENVAFADRMYEATCLDTEYIYAGLVESWFKNWLESESRG